MKHHEFSPSKLERLANCPYSYVNCKDWTSPGSAEASHGTLMHRAVTDNAVFETLSEHDQQIIFDIRIRYIDPLEGCDQRFEFPVQVHDDDGTLLTEGTLDYLVIVGDTANVADFKFGGRQVSADDANQQLPAYAAGVFEAFPGVMTIHTLIIQPAFGFDGNEDAMRTYTRDDLPKLRRAIRDIRQKCLAATTADAVPSADNCRYCNRNNCPAFRAKMTENFAVLQVNPDALDADMTHLTVDFADRLLCAKREIESIMEEKAAMAKKVIMDANGSEHFRIQPGRVTKRTDWKGLVKDHGIPEEEIAERTEEVTGEPFLMPRMRRQRAAAVNGAGAALPSAGGETEENKTGK